MNHYYIIPAALVVTLILTLLFSAFSKRPLSGLWLFFLLIFLATWSGQLWIRPFGPVYWGISWIPLFIIALFFYVLIIALLPPPPPPKPSSDVKAAEEAPFIALGIFLWIILILLAISIVFGYYRLTF
jgi:hypothetical protein